MCGTCGCGEDENITYNIPGETSNKHHHHSDAHHHGHDHHHHSHNHDHQHHSHTETQTIALQRNILSKNHLAAERNRGYFEALGIVALNLVSSPGSGKTSILERSIQEKGAALNCFIIEGDQQSMNDADRIKAAGAPVIQINTGNGCHLDALMVHKASKQLQVKPNSLLFIENVGNLVCPSLFDLGETRRVVIMSVTEGDDKAAKYPTMFETAHMCLINKTDLLPYVDFDVEKFKETALRINHHLEFIEVSAKTGEGMEAWYRWIDKLHEHQA